MLRAEATRALEPVTMGKGKQEVEQPEETSPSRRLRGLFTYSNRGGGQLRDIRPAVLTGLGFDKFPPDKFPPASGPASGRTARRAQVPGGRADRTGPGETWGRGEEEELGTWGLGSWCRDQTAVSLFGTRAEM